MASSRSARTVAVVATVVVILALGVAAAVYVTGSFTRALPPSPSASSSTTPSATPSETPAAPTPTEPPPPPDCRELTSVSPDTVEQVTGWAIQNAVDQGARDGATGVVASDAAGVPTTYKVATGDSMGAIADRLCMNTAYLITINVVRRGNTMDVFPGDVINLDAHRVTSVGTINGQTLHEAAWEPLPPQV